MAESSGPKRVRLDEFTITVSPTKFALSTAQASEVKDIAEEMVEAHLAKHEWSDGALYQYMGFLNIASVAFYGQSYSVIRCKGGLVSFDGASTEVPTQVEIQAMIQEVLHPSGGGDPNRGGSSGLTEALEATEDYSYVKETQYEVLWEPTPAPSIEEQEPPAPAPVETTSAPSLPPPTSSPGVVQVPVVDTPNSSTITKEPGSNGDSSLLGIVAGVAGGLVLVAALAFLFVIQRRKRRQTAAWRKNAAHHVHPANVTDIDDDADLEAGVVSKHDAAMSESGSSRLGRLFSATAAAVQGGGGGRMSSGAAGDASQGDVSTTPPQSSSEESDDDGLSDFEHHVEATVPVEQPLISLPVDTDDYVDYMGEQHYCTELESGIAALIALQAMTSEATSNNDYVDVRGNDNINDDKMPQVDVDEAVLFVDTNESDMEFSDGEGAVFVDPIIVPIDNAMDYDASEDEMAMEARQGVRQFERECGCSATLPTLELRTSRQIEENDDVNGDDARGEEGETAIDSNKAIVEDQEDEAHDDTAAYVQKESDLMLLVDTGDDGVVDVEHDDTEGAQDVEVQLNSVNDDFDIEVLRKTSNEKPSMASQDAVRPVIPAPYTRWSDVSSNYSHEPSISDDDELEFKAEDSWDFNDNDDDSAELADPFQTPDALPVNDKKPLLLHHGMPGVESHIASDETVESEVATITTGSDSDTLISDPFQTLSNAPTNDEKPLLSRLLCTYKLDKVETSASEERRRSRSAPPVVRNRTIDL